MKSKMRLRQSYAYRIDEIAVEDPNEADPIARVIATIATSTLVW